MTGIRDELQGAPLGHATTYPDAYDAALLFAVPRSPQRAAIGITGTLPFTGTDQWTAFELTWLDSSGKPEVAIATFSVPVTSPAIVESKSVKLYLGSFAQSRYAAIHDVAATIERDLAAAAGAPVTVMLTPMTTPGSLSVIIPVTDHGEPHVAALLGATEIPRSNGMKTEYITSVTHLAEIATARHVDVELNSRPFVDNAIARMDSLQHAKPGQRNPFIIGTDGFQKFIGMIGECGWVDLHHPREPM